MTPLRRVIDSLLAIVLWMRGCRGVLWVHGGSLVPMCRET